MPRSPLYLSQDRHGAYHFRVRVPERLRQHFNNKREIKRALKTDSRREAVRLARAHRVELDRVIEELSEEQLREERAKLRDLSGFAHSRIIEAERAVTHDDDTAEIVSAKIVREGMKPGEDAGQLHKEIVEQTRAEAAFKLAQKREAELHRAKMSNAASVQPGPAETPPAPQRQPSPPTPASPLLSEVIDRYIREKIGFGHWKERSAEQVQATLRDFLEIVGDIPLAEVTRQTITEFAAVFGKLPKNRNKMREFRGKSIADVLKMKGIEPIDSNTLKNNLGRVSSFFKWAKINQLIASNPAESVTWVLPKKVRRKNKIDARETFTVEEIQRLFHAGEFKKPKSPYQYWVPVIGLYSGARLEEICSRELNDIKQDGEVWYLDIKDTKTDAGTRQLPLHPKLIELGFLGYVERLRAKGETRLFPELKPNKYGECGPRAGKWFQRYRKRCGIQGADSKKCFHSFRHNVVDFLKQKGTPPEFIHAIVGHEDKIAHGTYGRRHQAASLKPYVDQIEFDLNIEKWIQK
jgi:integrase